MIDVKIANNVVEIASQLTLKLNRREEADSGYVKVLSNRKERYEPFSIIEITWDDKEYQMLVESDNVLKQKYDYYEHEITMIEPIAILSTIYPVDRSFTDVPQKTIREVLDIFEEELRYYQEFSLRRAFINGLDKKLVDKEYASIDMAAIIYDLFRTLDLIPRLFYNNNYWVLSGESYIARGNELTLSTVENDETQVNDIDYATETLYKSRNASMEQKGIWWPAKDKWAYPTFKGDIYKTSDLQFELDSDILKMYQVLAKAEVTVTGDSDELGPGFNEVIDLEVDITQSVVDQETYEGITTRVNNDFSNWQWEDDSDISPQNLYKQIVIKYSLDNNTIDGLFWQRDGLIFQNDVEALRNVFNSYVLRKVKLMPEYADVDNLNARIRAQVDSEDIQIRVLYQPVRDIDFVTERQDTSNFNKSTLLNNQKDSRVDLIRLMRNADLFVNRIGNKTITVTQSDEYWELGDYIVIDDEFWLITDITYNFDKDQYVIIAEFTRNFANTNRETAISRIPSPYVFTGKRLQSNFILREYILFGEDITNDTDIPDSLQNVITNILDYDVNNNKPITNAFLNDLGNITNTSNKKLVNAPLLTGGSGSAIILHAAMKDPRVAGNSSFESDGSFYKKPIFYTRDDFTVGDLYFTFARDYTVNGRDYPSVFVKEEDELISYEMPVNKDPNDSLAITWQLLSKSLNKNVIVYSGFVKYNNLINDIDSDPDIKLYTRATPYDKLETNITINDTLVSKEYSYLDTIDYDLIIQDDLDQAYQYWALAYDDELLIAGNNSVRVIPIRFRKNVEYKGYVENLIVEDDIYLMYLDKTLEFNFQATVELMELLRLSLEETLTYEFNTDAEVIVPYKYNYNKTLEYDFQVVTNVKSPFKVYYDKTLSYEFSAGIDLIAPYKYNYEETLDYQFSAEITLIEPYKVSYENILQYKFNVNAEIVIPEKFNYNKILGFDFNVTAVVGDLRWNFISSQGTEPTNPTYIDGGTDTNVSETVSPSDSPSDYNLGDIVYYNDGDPQTPKYYIYKVV